jgi:hypothetical protein
VAGGKLSNEKCNYYAVQWTHASTGRSKVTQMEYPSIQLEGINENSIYVKNVATAQYHKSLQSMENSNKFQRQLLKQKQDAFLNTLNAAELDYKEADIMYRTIYSPKVQYISQMLSVKNRELRDITKCATPSVLRKLGYSSMTPRGVTLGHRSYGGLEMIDVYIYQGSQNLINFVKNMSTTNNYDKLLITAYKWWRYTDGREICPLQSTLHNQTSTQSVWFEELRKFIHCYGIQIKMDDQTYPLLRRNDEYIMDMAYSRKYTQKVINNINQCRIFLRALSLSDTTTVDGISIANEHYTYSIATPIPIKGPNVCRMNKPNKSLWHYWTQFLNTITTRNSRRLILPLGEWIVPIHKVRRRYTTYRDHNHKYTTINLGFEKKNRQTSQVQQISSLPDHVIPCLVTPFGVFPNEYREKVPQQFLQQEMKHNNLILSDNIIIVTDALVQHGVSAIAWVVSDTNGNILQKKSLLLI